MCVYIYVYVHEWYVYVYVGSLPCLGGWDKTKALQMTKVCMYIYIHMCVCMYVYVHEWYVYV